MIKRSLAAVAFLFSAVAADVNSEFSAYLSGEQPLHHEVFEQMWQRFMQEHGAASPNNLKSDAHRKNAFADNLERVIEHNSNPSSYKKGINRFSDMTHEEFVEHFHLEVGTDRPVGEPQHCSATEDR